MRTLYTTLAICLLASTGWGQGKQPAKPDTSIQAVYKIKLHLKIGDRFFFGYSNSVKLFRVVDFNETGVFASYNFDPDGDNPIWFPFHDLYYSTNFKKLTKKIGK